jgi:hypothetical protein
MQVRWHEAQTGVSQFHDRLSLMPERLLQRRDRVLLRACTTEACDAITRSRSASRSIRAPQFPPERDALDAEQDRGDADQPAHAALRAQSRSAQT